MTDSSSPSTPSTPPTPPTGSAPSASGSSATPPCPECGTPPRVSGQSFCDSCGAFLRWDTPATATAAAGDTAPAGDAGPTANAGGARGARGATDSAAARSSAGGSAGTPAAARSERPAPPAPPTTPDTTAATGTADAARREVTPVPPAATDITVPLPTSAPDERAPQRDGAGTPTPPSDTAIRSLLVPVPEASEATAPPEAPGSVLPGRPETARPRVRQTAVAPDPETGLPCPACGALNAPRRHFCRSCANALKDSTAPAAEGPYAGQRPRLHRDRTRWIARAVAAAVVLGLLLGGIFGGPPAARAVQDHFAKRVPVHPTKYSASHSDPKQAPKFAFDGYSNTWWGPGYSGDSAGQWLQGDFGQPTDLLNLLITPGTSPRTAQSAKEARPMDFDLVVEDSAGKKHTSHHRINDGGVQKIDVRVRNAVTARLVLRSAYGASDERQVAIAELEYFGRSAGR